MGNIVINNNADPIDLIIFDLVNGISIMALSDIF